MTYEYLVALETDDILELADHEDIKEVIEESIKASWPGDEPKVFIL